LQAAGLVSITAKRAKVILAGELDRALTLRGLRLTKGARAALTAAGGTLLDE
jgi:large subunit ribosomal protein L15